MATRRITQASPSSHFHGKPWKVQRLPETASRSAPTFSTVGMPAASSVLCAGFHSGKSAIASRPVASLYSGSRYLICGPLRCGPIEVASGWSTVPLSTPTSLTFLSTSHSAARLAQARRVAEVFLAVGVALVPAGVDEDDVVGLHGGRGALEVGRLDQLPLALRDRQHDAGAEEALQREVADRLLLGQEVDRRVHVGRGVEDGDDLVRHHAVLGVIGDALELDLLVAGEDRRIHPPGMAELVELKPAVRIGHHAHRSFPPWTRQSGWPAMRATTGAP